MLMLLEECWTRVQETLRERAGHAAHAAWIAELKPLTLERGTVYLEAKNKMAADRVQTLFRPLLEDVLSQDIGTELRVEVQAREEPRFTALEVSPQQPVVDDGNRTAHLVLRNLLPDPQSGPAAAGRAAASHLPGRQFFFHGPSGVGKTFLLRWWREQLPGRTLWFEALGLLKAFQAAHQEKRVDGLFDELTQDRPLVLDEAHRLAGKPALQAFVLKVLQRRDALAQPTVLASRWHPKDIRDLDPSLATSLLAGFVAAIERPGPIGRLRYLRALEGAPSRNGRAQHVESLAQKVVGSYPELRAAWAAARGRTLPPKYLELIDPGRVFARVRDRVAEHFGVAAQDLVGKGQGRAVSRARKVLALLCQQQGLSGGEVGRYLGRTRAAVSYMVLSLQGELEKSAELRQQIEALG